MNTSDWIGVFAIQSRLCSLRTTEVGAPKDRDLLITDYSPILCFYLCFPAEIFSRKKEFLTLAPNYLQ